MKFLFYKQQNRNSIWAAQKFWLFVFCSLFGWRRKQTTPSLSRFFELLTFLFDTCAAAAVAAVIGGSRRWWWWCFWNRNSCKCYFTLLYVWVWMCLFSTTPHHTLRVWATEMMERGEERRLKCVFVWWMVSGTRCCSAFLNQWVATISRCCCCCCSCCVLGARGKRTVSKNVNAICCIRCVGFDAFYWFMSVNKPTRERESEIIT